MAAPKDLIVSVSGIRGVVGQGLTAEVALAFASAFGTFVKGGRVVLSRDGRPSGGMLRHAVVAGLMETGCEVHDLGIAATPTCGFALRRLQAAGGIQITASHNPAEWNGLKLFGADGSVLPPDRGREISAIFESRRFQRAAWDKLGTLCECRQANDWHCRRILELVNAERIRSRGFHVFLDANGGAGGPLGRQLLNELGCKTTIQGGCADGIFEHPPEPVTENLQSILPKVVQANANLGFVLDPDADRLAIIDDSGRYLGEEVTLALAAFYRLRQQSGPVVINISTSRMTEDFALASACPCHRSAVGEAHVIQKMREVGAVLGGEGNGGVIDPRVGFVRDAFIAMAMILDLLAEPGAKLSALVDGWPGYHIVKDKLTVSAERLAEATAALEKRWPDARANREDGLRLDWTDRWVHLRPSNTEPVVRIIAEARSKSDAEALCREVRTLLNNGA